jgi:hypothetical protein
MRHLIIGLAALAMTAPAPAQTYVHGYTKKDGTYVAPHYRSNADGNVYNNWSTKGNVNPYTGQAGTKNPYSSSNSTYGYSNPYARQSNQSSNYGYTNPYSSSSQSNGSATTCYYPPC